jgi:hypothetical protein
LDDLDGIGTHQLLKLYESIFCEKNEEDEYIPLPNKFDNWEKYFLQKVKVKTQIVDLKRPVLCKSKYLLFFRL